MILGIDELFIQGKHRGVFVNGEQNTLMDLTRDDVMPVPVFNFDHIYRLLMQILSLQQTNSQCPNPRKKFLKFQTFQPL